MPPFPDDLAKRLHRVHLDRARHRPHRLMAVLGGCVLLCATRSGFAADAVILAAAQAAQPDVVSTLHDLVAIESGSGNGPGVLHMADYTEARLKALGAQTERIASTQGPGVLVRGTFNGSGSKRIMLIAHMDTVYPEGTLASQPYHQEGNRLYGPGIADDKGGIAVILHSLAILKAQGWDHYARLTVLFNPDEEIGSVGSGETIARLADEHDVVLSCEPTVAKSVAKSEGILLGAAGTATAYLDVEGRAAHAGAAPELGRNALDELAYQILATRDVAKGIPGAQLSWTQAEGGVVRNQIPAHAQASADVRLTARDAADRLLAALQEKVAQGQLVPDTRDTVRLEVGRPPFVATDAARELARRAQAVYAELDGRPLQLFPGTGAATDAGYAGRSGKVIVLESFGLAGFGYHARDEYIELDSIVPRLYLMSRLLEEIGRG